MADLYRSPAVARSTRCSRACRRWQRATRQDGRLRPVGQPCEKQFHSAEQAIKLYKEALEAVPTQLDALKALERIYRSAASGPT